MGNIKRFHPPNFKAKVALEMIQGAESVAAICSKFAIHPTQAGKWKQQVLQGLEAVFSDRVSGDLKAKDEIIDELYKQIGQLKVELDWIKKKLSIN